MSLFQSTPYIIYSDTRFTSNDFGLAWGDVDGDGINELLVSPLFITASDQPVFLTYNGSTFVTKNIVVSDGGFSSDLNPNFDIFDIDNDEQQEVLHYKDNGTLDIWKYSDNALRKTGVITGIGNNEETGISAAKINGTIYLFTAGGNSSSDILIYSVSGLTATFQTAFITGLTNGACDISIRDIDCDGHLEMAVSGCDTDPKHIKFFRLMNPSNITSWSDLYDDLLLSDVNSTTETIQFANLENPCRWDLVVTTSVGTNPADILVYRNITNSCDTVSNFQLTTPCGQIISDRVCCHDDIIASWTVNNPNSTCSDNNVGFIQLTGPCDDMTHTLKRNTNEHLFSLTDCCTGPGQVTFFRAGCSDACDSFTRSFIFFETTVDAGSDQCILFGATATVGAGCTDPNTEYCWTGENEDDFVSDRHVLHTIVRPCQPGCNKYEVKAHDNEFPECKDFDCVDITVSEPFIMWSDVHQSDGGNNCTFFAHLLSSDTYTDKFHVTLKDTLTGSDIVDITVCTPYCFTQTVNKPILPGTTQYILTAALSDFEDCCHAKVSSDFFCTKPPVALPGGPSTFEMLIRLFGFLFLFIFFGLIFV